MGSWRMDHVYRLVGVHGYQKDRTERIKEIVGLHSYVSAHTLRDLSEVW
jgi:hypothetical protein